MMRLNTITQAMGPSQACKLCMTGRQRYHRPCSTVLQQANVQRCSRIRSSPATASLSFQKLFGAGKVMDLLATTTAVEDAADISRDAVTALQSCLKSGTAVLVGSVAAGLHLPDFDQLDIVVALPGFSLQTHAVELQNVAAALKGSDGQNQGFSEAKLGECSVQCHWKSLNMHILVGSSQPVSPLAFLNPDLTAHQRKALSASTAIATTAFLQQQPSLFKAAVRAAKHWAEVVHEKDLDKEPLHRPKPYLLVLLVLKAYQQYMVAVAASSSSSTSYPFAPVDPAGSNSNSSQDQEQEQAAAVEHIMVNFLRLAAGLSSNTLLFWELQYSSEVVQQVLARPDLATVLRPKGCESHPLVLDLANPTNNVAAPGPTVKRLKQVAAADLSLIDGDAIRHLQKRVLECKDELQTAQDELVKLRSEQERQAAYMTAMVMHQQIICRKPICRWSFEMLVADWLPDSKSKLVAGPKVIHEASGLSLEVFNLPLQYNDISHLPWTGLSFKLTASDASDGHASAQNIIDMLLPVPFKICSTSTVTLAANGSSSSSKDDYTSSTYSDFYGKGADDSKVLQGSSGPDVWFTLWLHYTVLSRLQLIKYHDRTRQQDLQWMKERTHDYVLKFDLRIQLG